ncbi:MAG: alpha/beta hydrolase domain-containing protein [Ideonella sp.]|nr:alpha/beta hydrolase domain-containing protein [Ideonella sp.]
MGARGRPGRHGQSRCAHARRYSAWRHHHLDCHYGFAPGAACGGSGATLPFAADAAARERQRPPLRSVAERYADEQAYLREVRNSIDTLSAQRLMLGEDAERWMGRAKAAFGAAFGLRRGGKGEKER